MEAITAEELSKDKFLHRCLEGFTQNKNKNLRLFNHLL